MLRGKKKTTALEDTTVIKQDLFSSCIGSDNENGLKEKSIKKSIKKKENNIGKEKEVPLEKKENNNKKTVIYKMTSFCERCGAQIDCEANIARLNSLTGRADWRRNCKLERIKLCDKCATELSDLIDKWILSKNPTLNKWG